MRRRAWSYARRMKQAEVMKAVWAGKKGKPTMPEGVILKIGKMIISIKPETF